MVTLLAAMVAPLVGCWEEPVDESLTLCIAPGGEVVATARTAVAGDEGQPDALKRRLAETRRTYEQGGDPWSRRFALLTPLRDRLVWEREQGVLVRAVRVVVLDQAEDLARLFSEMGAFAAIEVSDGHGDLTVVPGPAGGRATAEQRRQLAREEDAWSVDVAAHEAALSALYRYLDEHPTEASACFAGLLREVLAKGVGEEVGEPSDDAAALIEAARSTRRRVLRILEAGEGEAVTLNELAREVHDPFAPRIALVLPARPDEIEGFVVAPDGSLEIPRLDLLAALGRLENRWVRPDPLLEYVRALRDRQGRGVNLAALVSDARRVGPVPDAAAVREALDAALASPSRYHVTWSAPPPPGGEAALPCWPPLESPQHP